MYRQSIVQCDDEMSKTFANLCERNSEINPGQIEAISSGYQIKSTEIYGPVLVVSYDGDSKCTGRALYSVTMKCQRHLRIFANETRKSIPARLKLSHLATK